MFDSVKCTKVAYTFMHRSREYCEFSPVIISLFSNGTWFVNFRSVLCICIVRRNFINVALDTDLLSDNTSKK